MPRQTTTSTVRTVSAALIGTVIEWYDYGLFAYLAPTLAELFFPSQQAWVSLLLTFTVFAIGYILRPLGGMLFGILADRYGRVLALRTAILFVALPSVLIACLPTYASVGYLSTMALVILRLCQGISVGGEFAGAMVYLTETAPSGYKIMMSGLANNASNIGILAGVGFCMLLAWQLSHATFMAIGWRIPFLLGGSLGILGFYLRSQFQESPAFLALKQAHHCYQHPLRIIYQQFSREIIIGMLLCAMGACGIYTLTTYLSTYLQVVKHYSQSTALAVQSVLLVLTLFFVPCASWLAERYGRVRLLRVAVVGNIVYSVLAFSYLPENNAAAVCGLLLPLIVFMSLEQGIMPATVATFFPVAIRYSAVSIAYNVSYAYLGGTAPLYITWLLAKTNYMAMPGVCLCIASCLTGMGLFFLRRIEMR